jgi:hypothetical protein
MLYGFDLTREKRIQKEMFSTAETLEELKIELMILEKRMSRIAQIP